MSALGDCRSLLIDLQGYKFSVDFQVLPLHDNDVVLGTKWLNSLGPVNWDFQSMQMKFNWAGQEINL